MTDWPFPTQENPLTPPPPTPPEHNAYPSDVEDALL